jgi:uncharacterized damage-inducible protein DinB
MWHGPSVLEAIGDLSAADAAAHPIPHAHSAWEQYSISRRGLRSHWRGEGTPWNDPTPDEDWPPVAKRRGKREWTAAQRRADVAYAKLAAAVRALPAESLDDLVPGHEYTKAVMVHGVVEHGVYHAGQIVLLRKALAA